MALAAPGTKAATRDDGDDSARREIETRSARQIVAALRRQLAAAVPTGSTVDSLQQAGGVEAAITRARAESPGLRDALYSMLVEAVHLGVDRGQADTEAAQGVGSVKADTSIGLVDWTLVNSDARDWARDHAGTLVAGIDETTAKVLRSAISEWIDNKLSYAQLLREVASAFGEARAARIVATEVTNAYAAGSIRAWQAGGVITEMEWRTAVDERVCKQCGPRHGTMALVSVGFSPNPALHVSCRCWVVPVGK